jgi:ribosomal protein S18 acetylase RimI-like enzyme
MSPTAPEPRIIRATPDCAVELLALQRTCFREEAELYGEPDIAPLTQTLDGLLADFLAQTVLGAWTDGRLVGSVRARCEQEVCEIGRLVVHPDHRCKGLGTALMAAIERAYPEAATYELFTGERSERNLRLYRRLGYSTAGSRVVSPRLTLVLLRKPGTSGRADIAH